jgi:hypothetical protein
MDKYSMMKMPCEEIGRALACSGDDEQAAVINSLARELRYVCNDKELTGMQVCYFASKLDLSGKMLVKSLAEFVDLREKTDNR